MSKRYFVVSDVHSFYDELQTALNENGWDINNPNHIIISLGDLTDRGDFPKKCIEFMLDLYKQGRAILIRGNHEDLMEDAIARHYFESHDYHNCTTETAEFLTGKQLFEYGDDEILTDMKTNVLWNEYINATVDYAEIGDNIFVHGWIPTNLVFVNLDQFQDLPDYYKPTQPTYNPDWRNPKWGSDWTEARWDNGMKLWHMGIREPGKTIWCGHYHTSWGHSRLHEDGVEFLNRIETYYIDPDTGKQEPHANFDPFIDDGIVAMDACTALTGKVNCLTFEVEEDDKSNS